VKKPPTHHDQVAVELEYLQAQARWNAKSEFAILLYEIAAKVGLNLDRLLADSGISEAFKLVMSKYSEVVTPDEFREKLQQLQGLRDQTLE
jgi:hypothetical protein